MRPARTTVVVVVLAGLLAVTGALTSVVLARGQGSPVNELAVLLVVTVYAVVAVVINLARPGHRVGRLMLVGAAVWGIGEGVLAVAVRALDAGQTALAGWLASIGSLRGLGWLLLILGVPLVFPDGRSPWGGRRPVVLLVAAVGLFALGSLLAPEPLDYRLEGLDSATGLPQRLTVVADVVALTAVALIAVTLVVAVAGLVHRWRTGDPLLRQQLLWFSAAFAAPLLLIPLIPTPLVEPWMFAVVTAPVPVAIAVALFQHRLYDIQLVVNRTATFAALSVVVAALYAFTVAGVGAVLHERGAVWLPWVAAGVVAVTFAPLHAGLQRGVNRLTYGQWSQPREVLASTGRRLADATDVPGLLAALTEELGSGLGLASVEIADAEGRPLANYGNRQPSWHEVPLTAYGQPVGSLRLSAPRLRTSDHELLDDLAGQLGGVVHSARLVGDLRQAQERLVLAREEERRRLRRDLHDGLGPALAGLTLQVDTVRNLLATGADAERQLLELRDGVASTVLDVRRIVEGLRPPALDELGLDGALVQLAERMTQGSQVAVTVSVPDDLPRIPAAVEVAAYRVAQEALTNAVRHSGATRTDVVLTVGSDGIRVEVSDNGTGDVGPRPGGIGLTTMHERAAEIGGRLSIRGTRASGTRVALWLPCPAAVAT